MGTKKDTKVLPKKKAVAKIHSIRGLVRDRIIKGQYPPGERIPNRDELMRGFGVSCVTIQRALDRLKEDGFVRAVRGCGTFVVTYPPHLCRYGLVFPVESLQNPKEPDFYRWIYQAAREVEKTHKDVRFSIYRGMKEHSSHDAKDYNRLVNDVCEHRLAGLIFIMVDPQFFAGTPILEEPGISRVVHLVRTKAKGVSIIHSDLEAFIHMSLDCLGSRGRRRIAMLCYPETMPELSEYFWAAIAARDMTSKPYWIQCPSKNIEAGGKCIQMLLSGKGEDRPDGLISVEMFRESIIAGAVDAKLRIPEDLEVVIGSDIPNYENYPFPMRRLGCEPREFIETYIRIAREQAEGQFRPLTLLKPKFEEELS